MMNTKRWAILRKSSGKLIRSFGSRDAARSYKRDTDGSFMIFDNINQRVVR